ncbi:MAG: FAD:protein FMN transferase [Pseudomonas sp.]
MLHDAMVGIIGLAKYFSLLLFAALLSACGAPVEEFGGPTMGSHYSLKYVAGAATPAQPEVREAVEGILAEVDQQMSTWRPDSAVSRFNQLPAASCQTMPAPVLELVRFGEQLSRASGGAFDLTLQPLLDLWGFGPQSRGAQVPGAGQLAAVRARIGYRHLRIEGEQLCKDAAVRLDLDSIAAGYTVDRIGLRLGDLGITSYLLNVTGELKVLGRKPDGSVWQVALEVPRDDRQVAQQVLALDGQGVSTSGDYRNYFEQDGQRYSHTFDPHTGAPVRHDLASVTVIDPSVLRADGLSTLLMVLGGERGLAYAEQAGIAALFIRRNGQAFVSYPSPAFASQFGAGAGQ